MATGKKPAMEPAASPAPRPTTPRTATRAATILWCHDSPACVAIVDPPLPPPRDGVCRCPACHATEFDDCAERFLT